MALKKTLQINIADQSIELPDSYIRVASVNGTKEIVGFRVEFCSSSNGEIIREQSYTFKPDMSGANFIKQAYLHLKGLEYFADAVDC
jgi:hypothetical protein